MAKDKYSVETDNVDSNTDVSVVSFHPHSAGVNFVSNKKLYLLKREHPLFTELYALLLTATSGGGIRVWFQDGTQNSNPTRVVSGIAWDKT